MLHSCHGRLHLIASHASFASHNVGKLAKVRCNKSSGGSSNLCWGERSPFLKMGRVRLEGGNCRPPSGRSSTHLGCPRISQLPYNIPTTLSTNVSYPTIICCTIDQFCIRQPQYISPGCPGTSTGLSSTAHGPHAGHEPLSFSCLKKGNWFLFSVSP